MFSPNEGGAGSEHSTNLLARIAKVLDCPVSAFYDHGTCDQDHTIELLKLWFQITEDQDRLKVLGILRALTGSSSDQENNRKR